MEEKKEQEVGISPTCNTIGIISFIFGLISVFMFAMLFVPLALILGSFRKHSK